MEDEHAEGTREWVHERRLKDVERAYAHGSRPAVTVDPPALASRSARYQNYVSRVTYSFEEQPQLAFLPGHITDELRAQTAALVARHLIVAPKITVSMQVRDTAGGRFLNRRGPTTFVIGTATAATLATDDALWARIRQAVEREDSYDEADGLSYNVEYDNDTDAPTDSRLSGLALVFYEYRLPSGGARDGFGAKTLTDLKVAGGLCGQACLAYAGSPAAVRTAMSRADGHGGPDTRANKEARAMAARIGHAGRMDVNDFEKYVAVEPNARVVIFDHAKNIIKDTGARTAYPANVYLFLAGDHYQFIAAKHIMAFLRPPRDPTEWCHFCLKLQPARGFKDHRCARETCPAPACGVTFTSDADRADHLTPLDKTFCPQCRNRLAFTGCRDRHSCRYKVCAACGAASSLHADHLCFHAFCAACAMHYPAAAPHRCYITNLAPRVKKQEFYAYDIESTIDADGRHAIAVMVVVQLYTRATAVLRGDAGVAAWLDAHMNEAAVMLAHNAAAYDAPLVLQMLLSRPGNKPYGFVFVGEKLLFMRYGKIRFIDSLRHLAGSLESVAATFDLPLQKKGFFPYAFFTPANRMYVGPVPGAEHFPPRVAATAEFQAWHAAWGGREYSIDAECERYCVQDTLILCLALETYQREAVQLNGHDPLASVTIAAYAQKVYRASFMPARSIPVLTLAEYDFARLALQGGRTEPFKLQRDWTPAQVAAGEHGVYKDVVSLYPTVQMFDALPGDVLESRLGADAEPLAGAAAAAFVAASLAVVEFDIDPPAGLYLPLLMVKAGGKLVAGLRPIRGAVGTSVEVARALELGYTGLVVRRRITFAPRRDLFAAYVERFLALKQRHSARGADPNPGRCKIAKLMLNSLWGKYAQRDPECEYKMVTTTPQWHDLVHRYNNGPGNMVVLQQDGDWMLVEVVLDREKVHLATTNVALAAFVTSHGRLRLYAELHRLGRAALYCDTDSIVYAAAPGAYDVPTGRGLGEWTDETDGVPIVRFVALAPKTWSITLADGTEHTKCKGFPCTWATGDMYRALLAGSAAFAESAELRFTRHCKGRLGVTTGAAVKRLTFAFDKRVVVGDDTFPDGFT